MSEDDLVRRLQVGHDSGCAMSYGMHEHCCDCSYPYRQESAETILKLRQELAAARANLEIAECALLAHGYRKSCDIPACNCGDQWHHGGNAVARLVEIRDAISERESFKNNGKTILQCVKECVRSDIDLAEARQISGYDWDFLEAQAQSIRELQADLAAARAEIHQAMHERTEIDAVREVEHAKHREICADLAAARALLREFVACAVNLENGEMFCKVETKVV